MFVFSYKTSKKQLIVTGVCICLLIALLVVLTGLPHSTAPTASANADGADYLKGLGYTVTGGEMREIQLPEHSDSVISRYAAMLQAADMDITPYLGKRVQMYTYTITNHPNGDAVAHVYMYQNKVIAGDITVDGVPTILKPKDVQNGTAG